MATLLSALETQVRTFLNEPVASFWSSAELIAILANGTKDMWGAIVDLHQEHYQTLDVASLAVAAGTDVFTGVPATLFRVLLIEPVDQTGGGPYRNLQFVPRDYNSPEAINARAAGAQDAATAGIIYYSVSQAGAPVAAPTIHISPTLSSAIAAGAIRLLYIPTTTAVGSIVASDSNPIPGESDMALIAYCVAFARAKEREDGSPDPNWIAVYATEKQSILTRLTPRQEQEPEVVPDFFGW